MHLGLLQRNRLPLYLHESGILKNSVELFGELIDLMGKAVVEVDGLFRLALFDPQHPLSPVMDARIRISAIHLHQAVRFHSFQNFVQTFRRELERSGLPFPATFVSMENDVTVLVDSDRIEPMPTTASTELQAKGLIWIDVKYGSRV